MSREANPGTDSQFPAKCAGNLVSVPGLRRRVIQSPGECTLKRMKIVNQSMAAALVLAGGAAAQGVFESHGDVGMTPKAGALEFDAATADYRVSGGGADIWGTEDALHFAWKRLTGDVTLTADVRFVGAGAVANRKAVLMVRQDLTAGSAYADVALHGDGHTALQFRSAAGAVTGEVTSTIRSPVRLRMERRGNTFTVFAGKPGEELTTLGAQSVELAGAVYATVQDALAEYRGREQRELGMTKTRDADVLGLLVFLQHFALYRDNGRRRGRAFLDALREFHPPAPEASGSSPSSVILR